MRSPQARAIVLAGLLLQACVAGAREPELQTNPFSRPAGTEKTAVSPGAAAGKASATPMRLHGTVLAGHNSLANIGGTIIGLGQEINGYKLVSVRQQHVVLDKDGILKTIPIYDGNGARRDD